MAQIGAAFNAGGGGDGGGVTVPPINGVVGAQNQFPGLTYQGQAAQSAFPLYAADDINTNFASMYDTPSNNATRACHIENIADGDVYTFVFSFAEVDPLRDTDYAFDMYLKSDASDVNLGVANYSVPRFNINGALVDTLTSAVRIQWEVSIAFTETAPGTFSTIINTLMTNVIATDGRRSGECSSGVATGTHAGNVWPSTEMFVGMAYYSQTLPVSPPGLLNVKSFNVYKGVL